MIRNLEILGPIFSDEFDNGKMKPNVDLGTYTPENKAAEALFEAAGIDPESEGSANPNIPPEWYDEAIIIRPLDSIVLFDDLQAEAEAIGCEAVIRQAPVDSLPKAFVLFIPKTGKNN